MTGGANTATSTSHGSTESDLSSVLANKRILVCVGPGGVGKTTTAAALALLAARRGRKTLVLFGVEGPGSAVDPAQHVGAALGELDLAVENFIVHLASAAGAICDISCSQQRPVFLH